MKGRDLALEQAYRAHARRCLRPADKQSYALPNLPLWGCLREDLEFEIQAQTGHSTVRVIAGESLTWTQKPKLVLVPDGPSGAQDFESSLHEYCHWIVATLRERKRTNLGLDDENVSGDWREAQATATELWVLGQTGLTHLLHMHRSGLTPQPGSTSQWPFKDDLLPNLDTGASLGFQPPNRRFLAATLRDEKRRFLLDSLIDVLRERVEWWKPDEIQP